MLIPCFIPICQTSDYNVIYVTDVERTGFSYKRYTGSGENLKARRETTNGVGISGLCEDFAPDCPCVQYIVIEIATVLCKV